MPLEITRDKDGLEWISCRYDGPLPPPVPAGYRPLVGGEAVAVGDLAFDMIMRSWRPVDKGLIELGNVFGWPIVPVRALPAAIHEGPPEPSPEGRAAAVLAQVQLLRVAMGSATEGGDDGR